MSSRAIDYLVLALATVVAYHTLRFTKFLYIELNSSLYYLPGPRRRSLLFGSFQDIWSKDIGVAETQWLQVYGRTFSFSGFFGVKRLLTSDTKAISHILMNSYHYAKPKFVSERYQYGPISDDSDDSDIQREFLIVLCTGNGIFSKADITQVYTPQDNEIWARACARRIPPPYRFKPRLRPGLGDGKARPGRRLQAKAGPADHYCQPSFSSRRILNPAFGPAQIRDLTEVFVAKSNQVSQLRDIWANLCDGRPTRINVIPWYARATLDIIGHAGFDYSFDSLQSSENPSELHKQLLFFFQKNSAIRPTVMRRTMSLLSMILPVEILTYVQRRKFKAGITMERIGRSKLDAAKSEASGAEKALDNGRSIFSLLVKANLSLTEKVEQRMSDADVLALLLCLGRYSHSLKVLMPNKSFATNCSPSKPIMDDLKGRPYLDMVIRESLRLYAPVPMAARVAQQDDLIPLNQPYKDTRGVWHDSIELKKGQTFHIPIYHINCDEELWGPDALLFRPERWEALPASVTSIPDVWSNMLTFFGGAHSCIGYRSSIVEMKALLFSLLRAFEFELAVLWKTWVNPSHPSYVQYYEASQRLAVSYL
ncbi:cytochrome P450 [Mucidula mucida]|nr:cytochrome P450 [Mucidula mucida]